MSAAEVGDLCRAQWTLLWAQLLVWVLPPGRLLGGGSGAEPRRCSEGEIALASRVALALSRAAEHGVLRPACLVRAIALDRLLRRRGIDGARVRFGVRMGGGAFAAHAWVELDGLILGDEEWRVRSFTPVTHLHLVARGAARERRSSSG